MLCSPKRCSAKRKRRKRNKVFPLLLGGAGSDSPEGRRRHELEQLQDEARRVEEIRLEQEEQLWRSHEERLQELEEKRHLVETMKAEAQAAHAEAEVELEETRRNFHEECARNERQLLAELERLRGLEAGSLQPENVGAQGADAAFQDLSDIYGDEITRLKDIIEKQKQKVAQLEMMQANIVKNAEQEIHQRQQIIDEMFLASGAKIENERRKLEVQEETLHCEDAEQMAALSAQIEELEKNQHRQKKILAYIREKEQDVFQFGSERVGPIGESCSEESLSSPMGLARHYRLMQKRHSSLSEGGNKLGSQHAAISASYERIAMLTAAKNQAHSSSQKHISPLASPTDVKTFQAENKSEPKASPAKKGSPKIKKSLIAEQVTSRLYNPKQIKKDVDGPSGGARRKLNLPIVAQRTRSNSAPVVANLPKTSDIQRRLGKLRSDTGSTSSLASVVESIDESLEDEEEGGPLEWSISSNDSAFATNEQFNAMNIIPVIKVEEDGKSSSKIIPFHPPERSSKKKGAIESLMQPIIKKPIRPRPVVSSSTSELSIASLPADWQISDEDLRSVDAEMRDQPDGGSRRVSGSSIDTRELKGGAKSPVNIPVKPSSPRTFHSRFAADTVSSLLKQKEAIERRAKRESQGRPSSLDVKVARHSSLSTDRRSSSTPESQRRGSLREPPEKLPSPRGRGVTRRGSTQSESSLSPLSSRRGSYNPSLERSVSRESFGSGRSHRTDSIESARSERSTSRESGKSPKAVSRASSQNSINSVKLESDTSRGSSPSHPRKPIHAPKITPSSTKVSNATKSRIKAKAEKEKEEKPKAVKRPSPKSTLKSEHFLSKPKRRTKDTDIPVEIYLPGGGVIGGGGAGDASAGGLDDVPQSSPDHAHSIFAKSLRGGSIEKEWRPFTEEVFMTEEGLKIIRRKRRSEESLEGSSKQPGPVGSHIGKHGGDNDAIFVAVGPDGKPLDRSQTKADGKSVGSQDEEMQYANDSLDDSEVDVSERVSPEGQPGQGSDGSTANRLAEVTSRLRAQPEHMDMSNDDEVQEYPDSLDEDDKDRIHDQRYESTSTVPSDKMSSTDIAVITPKPAVGDNISVQCLIESSVSPVPTPPSAVVADPQPVNKKVEVREGEPDTPRSTPAQFDGLGTSVNPSSSTSKVAKSKEDTVSSKQELMKKASSPSTTRRSFRQRAQWRHQQQTQGGTTTDTDQAGTMSDDSLGSDEKSKTSSRPSSASKRRRRVARYPSVEKSTKRFKSQSSEEYVTSDNDSVYSEDSLGGSDGKRSDEAHQGPIAAAISDVTSSVNTMTSNLRDEGVDATSPLTSNRSTMGATILASVSLESVGVEESCLREQSNEESMDFSCHGEPEDSAYKSPEMLLTVNETQPCVHNAQHTTPCRDTQKRLDMCNVDVWSSPLCALSVEFSPGQLSESLQHCDDNEQLPESSKGISQTEIASCPEALSCDISGSDSLPPSSLIDSCAAAAAESSSIIPTSSSSPSSSSTSATKRLLQKTVPDTWQTPVDALADTGVSSSSLVNVDKSVIKTQPNVSNPVTSADASTETVTWYAPAEMVQIEQGPSIDNHKDIINENVQQTMQQNVCEDDQYVPVSRSREDDGGDSHNDGGEMLAIESNHQQMDEEGRSALLNEAERNTKSLTATSIETNAASDQSHNVSVLVENAPPIDFVTVTSSELTSEVQDCNLIMSPRSGTEQCLHKQDQEQEQEQERSTIRDSMRDDQEFANIPSSTASEDAEDLASFGTSDAAHELRPIEVKVESEDSDEENEESENEEQEVEESVKEQTLSVPLHLLFNALTRVPSPASWGEDSSESTISNDTVIHLPMSARGSFSTDSILTSSTENVIGEGEAEQDVSMCSDVSSWSERADAGLSLECYTETLPLNIIENETEALDMDSVISEGASQIACEIPIATISGLLPQTYGDSLSTDEDSQGMTVEAMNTVPGHASENESDIHEVRQSFTILGQEEEPDSGETSTAAESSSEVTDEDVIRVEDSQIYCKKSVLDPTKDARLSLHLLPKPSEDYPAEDLPREADDTSVIQAPKDLPIRSTEREEEDLHQALHEIGAISKSEHVLPNPDQSPVTVEHVNLSFGETSVGLRDVDDAEALADRTALAQTLQEQYGVVIRETPAGTGMTDESGHEQVNRDSGYYSLPRDSYSMGSYFPSSESAILTESSERSESENDDLCDNSHGSGALGISNGSVFYPESGQGSPSQDSVLTDTFENDSTEERPVRSPAHDLVTEDAERADSSSPLNITDGMSADNLHPSDERCETERVDSVDVIGDCSDHEVSVTTEDLPCGHMDEDISDITPQSHQDTDEYLQHETHTDEYPPQDHATSVDDDIIVPSSKNQEQYENQKLDIYADEKCDTSSPQCDGHLVDSETSHMAVEIETSDFIKLTQEGSGIQSDMSTGGSHQVEIFERLETTLPSADSESVAISHVAKDNKDFSSVSQDEAQLGSTTGVSHIFDTELDADNHEGTGIMEISSEVLLSATDGISVSSSPAGNDEESSMADREVSADMDSCRHQHQHRQPGDDASSIMYLRVEAAEQVADTSGTLLPSAGSTTNQLDRVPPEGVIPGATLSNHSTDPSSTCTNSSSQDQSTKEQNMAPARTMAIPSAMNSNGLDEGSSTTANWQSGNLTSNQVEIVAPEVIAQQQQQVELATQISSENSCQSSDFSRGPAACGIESHDASHQGVNEQVTDPAINNSPHSADWNSVDICDQNVSSTADTGCPRGNLTPEANMQSATYISPVDKSSSHLTPFNNELGEESDQRKTSRDGAIDENQEIYEKQGTKDMGSQIHDFDSLECNPAVCEHVQFDSNEHEPKCVRPTADSQDGYAVAMGIDFTDSEQRHLMEREDQSLIDQKPSGHEDGLADELVGISPPGAEPRNEFEISRQIVDDVLRQAKASINDNQDDVGFVNLDSDLARTEIEMQRTSEYANPCQNEKDTAAKVEMSLDDEESLTDQMEHSFVEKQDVIHGQSSITQPHTDIKQGLRESQPDEGSENSHLIGNLGVVGHHNQSEPDHITHELVQNSIQENEHKVPNVVHVNECEHSHVMHEECEPISTNDDDHIMGEFPEHDENIQDIHPQEDEPMCHHENAMSSSRKGETSVTYTADQSDESTIGWPESAADQRAAIASIPQQNTDTNITFVPTQAVASNIALVAMETGYKQEVELTNRDDASLRTENVAPLESLMQTEVENTSSSVAGTSMQATVSDELYESVDTDYTSDGFDISSLEEAVTELWRAEANNNMAKNNINTKNDTQENLSPEDGDNIVEADDQMMSRSQVASPDNDDDDNVRSSTFVDEKRNEFTPPTENDAAHQQDQANAELMDTQASLDRPGHSLLAPECVTLENSSIKDYEHSAGEGGMEQTTDPMLLSTCPSGLFTTDQSSFTEPASEGLHRTTEPSQVSTPDFASSESNIVCQLSTCSADQIGDGDHVRDGENLVIHDEIENIHTITSPSHNEHAIPGEVEKSEQAAIAVDDGRGVNEVSSRGWPSVSSEQQVNVEEGRSKDSVNSPHVGVPELVINEQSITSGADQVLAIGGQHSELPPGSPPTPATGIPTNTEVTPQSYQSNYPSDYTYNHIEIPHKDVPTTDDSDLPPCDVYINDALVDTRRGSDTTDACDTSTNRRTESDTNQLVITSSTGIGSEKLPEASHVPGLDSQNSSQITAQDYSSEISSADTFTSVTPDGAVLSLSENGSITESIPFSNGSEASYDDDDDDDDNEVDLNLDGSSGLSTQIEQIDRRDKTDGKPDLSESETRFVGVGQNPDQPHEECHHHGDTPLGLSTGDSTDEEVTIVTSAAAPVIASIISDAERFSDTIEETDYVVESHVTAELATPVNVHQDTGTTLEKVSEISSDEDDVVTIVTSAVGPTIYHDGRPVTPSLLTTPATDDQELSPFQSVHIDAVEHEHFSSAIDSNASQFDEQLPGVDGGYGRLARSSRGGVCSDEEVESDEDLSPDDVAHVECTESIFQIDEVLSDINSLIDSSGSDGERHAGNHRLSSYDEEGSPDETEVISDICQDVTADDGTLSQVRQRVLRESVNGQVRQKVLVETVNYGDYVHQHDTPPISPMTSPRDRSTTHGLRRDGSDSDSSNSCKGSSPLMADRAAKSQQQQLKNSALKLMDDINSDIAHPDLPDQYADFYDPGTFEVVHYKAPSPKPKRKRSKISEEIDARVRELRRSSLVYLDSEDFTELARNLSAEQGYVSEAGQLRVCQLRNFDSVVTAIESPNSQYYQNAGVHSHADSLMPNDNDSTAANYDEHDLASLDRLSADGDGMRFVNGEEAAGHEDEYSDIPEGSVDLDIPVASIEDRMDPWSMLPHTQQPADLTSVTSMSVELDNQSNRDNISESANVIEEDEEEEEILDKHDSNGVCDEDDEGADGGTKWEDAARQRLLLHRDSSVSLIVHANDVEDVSAVSDDENPDELALSTLEECQDDDLDSESVSTASMSVGIDPRSESGDRDVEDEDAEHLSDDELCDAEVPEGVDVWNAVKTQMLEDLDMPRKDSSASLQVHAPDVENDDVVSDVASLTAVKYSEENPDVCLKALQGPAVEEAAATSLGVITRSSEAEERDAEDEEAEHLSDQEVEDALVPDGVDVWQFVKDTTGHEKRMKRDLSSVSMVVNVTEIENANAVSDIEDEENPLSALSELSEDDESSDYIQFECSPAALGESAFIDYPQDSIYDSSSPSEMNLPTVPHMTTSSHSIEDAEEVFTEADELNVEPVPYYLMDVIDRDNAAVESLMQSLMEERQMLDQGDSADSGNVPSTPAASPEHKRHAVLMQNDSVGSESSSHSEAKLDQIEIQIPDVSSEMGTTDENQQEPSECMEEYLRRVLVQHVSRIEQSQSDSAIGSDLTDVESGTVSPRSRRLQDFSSGIGTDTDQGLMSDTSFDPVDKLFTHNIPPIIEDANVLVCEDDENLLVEKTEVGGITVRAEKSSPLPPKEISPAIIGIETVTRNSFKENDGQYSHGSTANDSTEMKSMLAGTSTATNGEELSIEVIEENKPVQFVDTQVMGFDVPSSVMPRESPDEIFDPNDRGQQLVLGSQSKANFTVPGQHGTIQSDMQVMGLQPKPKASPTPESEEPERVFAEDPEAECQKHLKHAALHIEIKPWRMASEPVKHDDANQSTADATSQNPLMATPLHEVQSSNTSDSRQIPVEHIMEESIATHANNANDIQDTCRGGQGQSGVHTENESQIGQDGTHISSDSADQVSSDRPDLNDHRFIENNEGLTRTGSLNVDSFDTNSMNYINPVEMRSDLLKSYDENEYSDDEVKLSSGSMSPGEVHPGMLSSRELVHELMVAEQQLLDNYGEGTDDEEEQDPDQLSRIDDVDEQNLSSSESSSLADDDVSHSLSSSYPRSLDIAGLPELVAPGVKSLRDLWMGKLRPVGQRSLSLTELEIEEPRNRYESRSFSVDCLPWTDNLDSRCGSSDSITYIFMSHAHSYDGILDEGDLHRQHQNGIRKGKSLEEKKFTQPREDLSQAKSASSNQVDSLGTEEIRQSPSVSLAMQDLRQVDSDLLPEQGRGGDQIMRPTGLYVTRNEDAISHPPLSPSSDSEKIRKNVSWASFPEDFKQPDVKHEDRLSVTLPSDVGNDTMMNTDSGAVIVDTDWPTTSQMRRCRSLSPNSVEQVDQGVHIRWIHKEIETQTGGSLEKLDDEFDASARRDSETSNSSVLVQQALDTVRRCMEMHEDSQPEEGQASPMDSYIDEVSEANNVLSQASGTEMSSTIQIVPTPVSYVDQSTDVRPAEVSKGLSKEVSLQTMPLKKAGRLDLGNSDITHQLLVDIPASDDIQGELIPKVAASSLHMEKPVSQQTTDSTDQLQAVAMSHRSEESLTSSATSGSANWCMENGPVHNIMPRAPLQLTRVQTEQIDQKHEDVSSSAGSSPVEELFTVLACKQVLSTKHTQPSSIQQTHPPVFGAPVTMSTQTGNSLDDLRMSPQASPKKVASEKCRTIETQTYPEVRVIETQTVDEVRVIETQTDVMEHFDTSLGEFMQRRTSFDPREMNTPADGRSSLPLYFTREKVWLTDGHSNLSLPAHVRQTTDGQASFLTKDEFRVIQIDVNDFSLSSAGAESPSDFARNVQSGDGGSASTPRVSEYEDAVIPTPLRDGEVSTPTPDDNLGSVTVEVGSGVVDLSSEDDLSDVGAMMLPDVANKSQTTSEHMSESDPGKLNRDSRLEERRVLDDHRTAILMGRMTTGPSETESGISISPFTVSSVSTITAIPATPSLLSTISTSTTASSRSSPSVSASPHSVISEDQFNQSPWISDVNYKINLSQESVSEEILEATQSVERHTHYQIDESRLTPDTSNVSVKHGGDVLFTADSGVVERPLQNIQQSASFSEMPNEGDDSFEQQLLAQNVTLSSDDLSFEELSGTISSANTSTIEEELHQIEIESRKLSEELEVTSDVAEEVKLLSGGEQSEDEISQGVQQDPPVTELSFTKVPIEMIKLELEEVPVNGCEGERVKQEEKSIVPNNAEQVEASMAPTLHQAPKTRPVIVLESSETMGCLLPEQPMEVSVLHEELLHDRPPSRTTATQYEELQEMAGSGWQPSGGSAFTSAVNQASGSSQTSVNGQTVTESHESANSRESITHQHASNGHQTLNITNINVHNNFASQLSPQSNMSTDTAAERPVSVTKDEACETDVHMSTDTVWDDELERLRRERQRILDMLARDAMPSKLQVELAEAQLNYIIGQTDTLLSTIDEPSDWDSATLLRLSHGEEQLSAISEEHLQKYRQTLEESRLQIELQIKQMERERERNGRNQLRSRQIARLKRDAQINSFKLEREREQSNYEHMRSLPRSRSDSPAYRLEATGRPRTISESSTISVGSNYTPPTPLSVRFLTPKQRKQHLIEMRKGIINSVRHDEQRSRSASPNSSYRHHDIRSLPSSTPPRSFSPIFTYSTYSYTQSSVPSTHSLPPPSPNPSDKSRQSPYQPPPLPPHPVEGAVGYSLYSTAMPSTSHLRPSSPLNVSRDTSMFSPSSDTFRSSSRASLHGRRRTGSSGPDYSDTASISSVISSLDDDSQQLLNEYQMARGRVQQEIRAAHDTLDKNMSVPRNLSVPAHTTSVRSTPPAFDMNIEALRSSLLSTNPLYSSLRRGGNIEKRAHIATSVVKKLTWSAIDQAKLHAEIDNEIEILKHKYGMMSSRAPEQAAANRVTTTDRGIQLSEIVTTSSSSLSHSVELHHRLPTRHDNQLASASHSSILSSASQPHHYDRMQPTEHQHQRRHSNERMPLTSHQYQAMAPSGHYSASSVRSDSLRDTINRYTSVPDYDTAVRSASHSDPRRSHYDSWDAPGGASVSAPLTPRRTDYERTALPHNGQSVSSAYTSRYTPSHQGEMRPDALSSASSNLSLSSSMFPPYSRPISAAEVKARLEQERKRRAVKY